MLDTEVYNSFSKHRNPTFAPTQMILVNTPCEFDAEFSASWFRPNTRDAAVTYSFLSLHLYPIYLKASRASSESQLVITVAYQRSSKNSTAGHVDTCIDGAASSLEG